MTDLENKIREASQAYYSDGTSTLSDEEFDELLDRLREENPDSPLLGVGHGYDVMKDTSPSKKHDHKYGVMGSLPKCRNWKELDNSIKNRYVDLSLKLDGLSVVLYYKEGVLTKALTRGDGKIGIDVTNKVIKIVPHSRYLNTRFTGAVRGEVVMSIDSFKEYHEKHPESKNPRNSAAGIMNGKSLDDLSYLNILVYTIVGDEDCDYLLVEYIRNKLVGMFGEDYVVPHSEVLPLSESDFILMMDSFKSKWYGKYPADGIVITKNDLNRTSDYSVVYESNAYKFPSEIRETEVTSVEWNMSKTRNCIPVVHIKPIELAGGTIQKCSGYHAQWIRDYEVGPGAIVTVERRGEIIPNIQEVLKKSTEVYIPTVCPDCGSELKWSGVHLMCENINCGNATQQDTLEWLKYMCPTDGLGDILKLKYLNDLVDNKIIEDISIESIMECNERLAENTKSVQDNLFSHMWNELHGDSDVELEEALKALNVPRLGDITSTKLSKHIDLIDKMKDNTSLDDSFWNRVADEIGEANSKSFRDNVYKFSRLRYIWNRIKSESSEVKFKVAVTGSLSVKRSVFETELKASGFMLSDMNRGVSFLITDNPNGSSSKNKKADQWGIEKISEEEFRKRFMKSAVKQKSSKKLFF